MGDPKPGDAQSKPGKEKANDQTAKDLRYVCYGDQKESPYLPAIKSLISKDLSEPYSIYVYRYFLYQWGDLCFMVRMGERIEKTSLTLDRHWIRTTISSA